ncbi:hypothetical protein [Undibacterium sp. TJN19]|uniref:hypothetical protein n=1 Tax=Undibacterium sp. TJN19 TaxID=3413055 RepID=UPI003BF3B711
MQHTPQLQVVGNAIFDAKDSRCLAIAYGWKAEPHYDASGKISNPDALLPSDEAVANARLWASAPELLAKARALVSKLPQDPQWCAAAEASDFRRLLAELGAS